MKTRLLKKIHKRFSWKYDHEEERWYVLDHKEKYGYHKKETYDVINSMIGMDLSWSYYRKRVKRTELKLYRDISKKYFKDAAV